MTAGNHTLIPVRRRERDSSEPISVRYVVPYTYDSTPETIKSSVVSLMYCTSTVLYHLVTRFEGNLRATRRAAVRTEGK
jgi:hypothetical protein